MVQLSLFSALALALPLVSGVTTPSCVLACATQNPDCTVIGDLACACGPGATKMDLCIKNSCSNDVNGGRLWFTNHCASLGYNVKLASSAPMQVSQISLVVLSSQTLTTSVTVASAIGKGPSPSSILSSSRTSSATLPTSPTATVAQSTAVAAAATTATDVRDTARQSETVAASTSTTRSSMALSASTATTTAPVKSGRATKKGEVNSAYVFLLGFAGLILSAME